MMAHQASTARSPRRRWTKAEDLQLTLLWGSTSGIDVIAEQLGRSPCGVRYRAVVVLGLGPMAGGRMTCSEASRYAGWDREALQRAARALDIRWHTHPVSKPELVGRARRRPPAARRGRAGGPPRRLARRARWPA